MTDTKYGLLFTVDLLHKYFTNQLCSDIIITPSAKTMEILNGHKIIAKQYQHQFFAGVELDGTGKPLPVPEEGMQITLFLQLNNPLFFNYTNLPFTHPAGKLYYFTNRNNNRRNGKNFLSSDIAVYHSSKTYKPGDLAKNLIPGTDTSNVFQAIRTSSSVSPFNLANTDYWRELDANRYTSEQDSVQWLASKSTYHFTAPQSSADIRVFGFNHAMRDYSNLSWSATVTFRTAVSDFILDLSMLQPGKYKLWINGVEQWIYLNDELTGKKIFAVIDIFNESDLPPDYQLLDSTGNLTSPQYAIYFLNRSSFWKYILTRGSSGVIDDADNVYDFPTLEASIIFSTSPIPLHQKPLNLTLTMDGHEYTSIPCASPERLSNHTNAGDVYYCSEIFLNQ
jgi:hypothetical protein